MVFLHLFFESFRFAVQALVVNRLRTFLSLLGISIGIFCIILVYSLTDSLEKGIRDSVSSLGTNVLYVQKWSWGGGGGEYQWWKIMNWPEPSYREFKQLQSRTDLPEAMSYALGVSGTAKYKENSVENARIVGSTHDFMDIWKFDLSSGRYYTEHESDGGVPYVIIGQDIADGLFLNMDPIGREIKLLGQKFTVIGVFEKSGNSMIGQRYDDMIMMPATYLLRIVSEANVQGTNIMVKGPDAISMEELKDEIRGKMRAIRRLSPKAEDNFSLNEISAFAAVFDQIFSIVGIAGTIIGGFAILVGGFGIANIMFVSVKERTDQIGIQKSLGARRSFILWQFLLEAIILSILGGFLGLILVFGGIQVVNQVFDMTVSLTLENILTGLFISLIVGIISGLVPAGVAARMDPVEAIRAGS